MPVERRRGNPATCFEEIDMLKAALAAALALTALGTFTVTAQAGDPGFCEGYARRAVAQYVRYRSIPGCFRGANRRWNPSFNGHYGWCLRAPYGAARIETAWRSERLRGC
jgi:hypothetical protein